MKYTKDSLVKDLRNAVENKDLSSIDRIAESIINGAEYTDQTAKELQRYEISTENTLIELRQEIRFLGEKMQLGFDRMDQRFEDLIKYSDKRFDDFQKNSDKRFEDFNKRFEDFNKRFEEMNKHIDRRFEDMQRNMDRNFTRLQWTIGGGFTLVLIVIGIMRVFSGG